MSDLSWALVCAVYDIDPFGARLPAALGLRGTAGEGLEVQAATLRFWMTR